MDISNDVKGFLYIRASTMEVKILRTLNTICLNFPLFSSSSPSNVVVFARCALYPVLKVFVYPNIFWRGEGRAIRGIQSVTELHMMLHLHI